MEDWINLNLIKKTTPVNFNDLLNIFKTSKEIFKAAPSEIAGVTKLSLPTVQKIFSIKKENRAKKEISLAKKLGFSIITIEDEAYPEPLRHIHNPPVILYINGKIKPSDKVAIAVVGARKASPYGVSVAEWLGEKLAEMGLTIVSGMARGVDSSAHKGALQVKGGRTFAILGSGLDIIYPPENKILYKKIRDNGAVISEFPLGTPPNAWNFPARNRIISGLSFGVVVVEAGEKSGSLITANFAMEQGKEVFAVPGSIKSPSSKGTNKLIKDGAKLTETLEDILEELPVELEKKSKEKIKPAVTEEENKIMLCLEKKEMVPEEIIAQAKLKPQVVTSLLLQLELKGLVKRTSGNFYFLID